MKFLSFFLFSATLGNSGLSAAAQEGVWIDQVWSGHPVGFDLLTERGHQFIAYFDSERRLTVKGRSLGTSAWTSVHPEGTHVPRRERMSNKTGWDSHNYVTLALDRDGCLHLSGNMHADPLVYYRTSRPFDLKTLTRIDHMTGENEQRVTYPKFLTNDAGDLLFHHRDGGSGSGNDYYNIYDPQKLQWKRLFDGPLLDGEGERSAYSLGPRKGPDGRYHLLWMWRDTPDAMTNHTLSYARSKDLIHWETSSGKPLARPLRLAGAEVVDPAKPGEGLINAAFTLSFDHDHLPLALYHRFDHAGKSQAFVARPDPQGRWAPKPISDWNFRWDFSGNGSQEIPLTLGTFSKTDDGNLTASFWSKEAGAGRWLLNSTSLQRIDTLPPSCSLLPKELEKPSGTFPGLGVRKKLSEWNGDRWMLRWETLGPNRDLKHREAPPPSELRLFRLSSSEAKQDYLLTRPGELAAVRKRLSAGDAAMKPALDALLKSAEAALKVVPPSVTQKTKPAPSGDVHDYASTAPYLWPDPNKPDGLPYVAQDGKINPESRTAASDLKRLELMANTVNTLAFAYYFTAREDYADHAARCLRVWFTDPDTRMNPSLSYAQGVPGLNEGRPIGIIEGGSLVTAADAAGLLVGSTAWTPTDQADLAAWMTDYLQWLLESPFGRSESEMKQNHGTSYDVQITRLALMLGRTELAKRTAEIVKTKRIALQIEPDGSQPLELKRTKAFNYSRLNLQALAMLAVLGERAGVDLWHYETADGRSIRKAVNFMMPYVKTPPEKWPYPQITTLNRSELASVFRLAGIAYENSGYEQVVAGLPGSEQAMFQLMYPLMKNSSNQTH